jgi:hypothetical protein
VKCFWGETLGLEFAGEIRRKRKGVKANLRWEIDEVLVKINSDLYYIAHRNCPKHLESRFYERVLFFDSTAPSVGALKRPPFFISLSSVRRRDGALTLRS